MQSKTVCDVDMCAGCMACIDACPVSAIDVKDELKHFNAVIDSTKCIKCGVCHRVCQMNYPSMLRKPIQYYQGWADEKNRNNSTSGGFASAIMQYFIKQGGDIASCKFSNGGFGFQVTNNINEIKNFAGSKYVKSNPVGIYKQIRVSLRSGRKVLFVGLPCQVSALLNFIEESLQANLYTIDLICHGTPSVQFLDMYLSEYGYSINLITNVKFRNNNKYFLYFNAKKLLPECVVDRYTLAFLKGLIFTENCYHCHYAQINRVSDLTLGDSWGSDLEDFEGKGISLALCNSEKGIELVRNSGLNLFDVNIQNVIESNRQLNHPCLRPASREKIFINIDRGMKFSRAVKKALPMICIRQDIKELLCRLHLWG